MVSGRILNWRDAYVARHGEAEYPPLDTAISVARTLRLEDGAGQRDYMDGDKLRLYRALSRAPFPKSYVGKVFLTAFLGTHVPLLALLAHFVRLRRFGWAGALRILSVTIPATLGGRL